MILNFEHWCMTVSVDIALISQWMVAAVLLDEFFDLGQNLGIFTHYANQDKAELFYPSWRHLTVGLFCRFFFPRFMIRHSVWNSLKLSHFTWQFHIYLLFLPNLTRFARCKKWDFDFSNPQFVKNAMTRVWSRLFNSKPKKILGHKQ